MTVVIRVSATDNVERICYAPHFLIRSADATEDLGHDTTTTIEVKSTSPWLLILYLAAATGIGKAIVSKFQNADQKETSVDVMERRAKADATLNQMRHSLIEQVQPVYVPPQPNPNSLFNQPEKSAANKSKQSLDDAIKQLLDKENREEDRRAASELYGLRNLHPAPAIPTETSILTKKSFQKPDDWVSEPKITPTESSRDHSSISISADPSSAKANDKSLDDKH